MGKNEKLEIVYSIFYLGTFQGSILFCQHKTNNRNTGTQKRLQENSPSPEAGFTLRPAKPLFSGLLTFILALANYTRFATSLL
jgi:hypothetical protein